MTAADFLSDHVYVGTGSLVANPRKVSEATFDLARLLDILDGITPDLVGFKLRESESTGGLVALEYLLLGTLVPLQRMTQTQPGARSRCRRRCRCCWRPWPAR